ncbi:MAG: glycosyltransferase family 4 protein [Verrucomicrobiota bacterium]|nr:glycosyltransferase family 4 protein [Verrucomicrobiota bacterium]
MAHALECDGRFKAVPLYPSAQLEFIREDLKDFVVKLNRREQEVTKLTQDREEGRLLCDFPVIHSLGNFFHEKGMTRSDRLDCRGTDNYSIIFFEDNSPNEHTTENAGQFEIIFGGSSWNSRVLKDHGLANVDTFLQGVDLKLFSPARKLDDEKFVIFSGGKLEYRKGQDIIVAAFREFAETHPDAILAAAWNNPWPESMASIAQSGLVDGVPEETSDGTQGFPEWVGANGVPVNQFHDSGLVPNHLMPKLFSQVDLAVFPNRCEGGTNLVAMEAMACGIPCILSANTGHLDLIEDDNCYPLQEQGEVAPRAGYAGTKDWGESDVAEVVECFERVYTDRTEARRRGEQATKFMQDWSWEKRTSYLIDRITQ